MSRKLEAFRKRFVLGEVNRMTGSGGEILVKAPENRQKGRDTQIEIGDSLIGIGVTHFIESMERLPDPNLAGFPGVPISKLAARAFTATSKEQVADGIAFRFAPLPPAGYAKLIEEVSHGAAQIEPDSIPQGTMILSFIMGRKPYSLARSRNSPGANWKAVLSGERHWNVGVSRETDFWYAKFPSDDVAAVCHLPPWSKLGQIRFGLSLLDGSRGAMKMEPIAADHPDGKETSHDFCLSGYVSGTRGLVTDFYIGLRTEILCKPLE